MHVVNLHIYQSLSTQDLCKKKGLNYLLNDGNELYAELFNVQITNAVDTEEQKRQAEKERQEKLIVQQKNRKNFDKYVQKYMKDKLFQELMFNAPVPDTRALKPQIYRPLIPKEGITAALITLGVTEATASCMVEEVGVFPADRHLVRKSVCKHTCTVCHQHELKDGTKVLGFEPVHKMVSLTVAPWSEWKRASSKAKTQITFHYSTWTQISTNIIGAKINAKQESKRRWPKGMTAKAKALKQNIHGTVCI